MVEKEVQKGLLVFQDRSIRRLWHDDQWFYSVVDIVAVLSESDNPTTYWRVLKHREPQLVTICNGLKMPAEDGKLRYTDCVNTNACYVLFPYGVWENFVRKVEKESVLLARSAFKTRYQGFGTFSKIIKGCDYFIVCMAEELEVFDLNGKLLGVQDRKKFYSEIKKEFDKKGKISRQVKSIRLILMNSSGRIYLQKRSKSKLENSGLYDKTVGGHVSKGDSWNMTVIRECAEELGFPAAILLDEEFAKAKKVTDLSIVGVFRKVDEISKFESVRIDNKGNKFVQPYITAIYIGYYDGAIRFVDGESSGIEVFSLDELKEEIKENPNKFTEDINFMIKKYEKFLLPIN